MRRFAMFVFAVLLFAVSVRSVDVADRQSAMLGTDKLQDAIPNGAREYMEEIDPKTADDFFGQAIEMVRKAVGKSAETLKKAVRTAGVVLITAIFCALAASLTGGKSEWAVTMAGVLAIGLCCLGDLKSMIGLGKQTIEELSVFTKMLIPVMAAATTAAGAAVSASAIQAGTVLFMQLLVSFFNTVLVPLVYAQTALALADTALEQGTLSGVRKFIGNFLKKSLQIVLFVFSGYMSLSGIISGSADALTVKAAKMTVSSVVPVVGSMISDASETVLVSAKLLRNSVGIFGMLAVLAIMIVPFLRLSIQYLVLQITSVLCSLVGGKAHSSLVGSISSAMGYLVAMVGCCGLMTFISCICFMKVSVL